MRSKVLVTGGAGFIGSNFLNYMVPKYPELDFVNLDKLTYAADLKNLDKCIGLDNYHFVEADISDKEQVASIFKSHEFQAVYHFAAESHVDNSITGPETFITTNINGTFNLIEEAKKLWLDADYQVKDRFTEARFLHISTDEVYGTLGDTGLFTEETPYAPNSPYSASKASSDMLVRSYFHTYGLNVVTTNCSNNYGPFQHQEKLIPTIIRKAAAGENIPVYGDGKNIRDWLFVEDHCKGIELAFEKGRSGETYNIGGRNEKQNIEVVREICSVLDDRLSKDYKHESLIAFVKDRPGHDQRYAIDASKIEGELSWKAEETFSTGILRTVDYYLSEWNLLT